LPSLSLMNQERVQKILLLRDQKILLLMEQKILSLIDQTILLLMDEKILLLMEQKILLVMDQKILLLMKTHQKKTISSALSRGVRQQQIRFPPKVPKSPKRAQHLLPRTARE
jgi:hypothetical protein